MATIERINTDYPNADSFKKGAQKVNDNFDSVNTNLSDQDKRITNIVGQAGTSNTEIVDARTNNRGKVFDVLKDRLDAVDVDLKERAVNVKWYGASGSPLQTTGSIDAGSNILTVANRQDFNVGQGISVESAGPNSTYEVQSLQITAGATTTGAVGIGLDGGTVYVDVVAGDSTTTVADKIRNAAFTGWTAGGTVGTDIVTFTSTTYGDKVDGFFDPGPTGATGTMTTTTQGVSDLLVSAVNAIDSASGTITLADTAGTTVSNVDIKHSDTIAIKNALQYAFDYSLSVYYPPGNYIIDGRIIIMGNGYTSIRGAGYNLAKLVYTQADSSITFNINEWYRGSVDIQDIGIHGTYNGTFVNPCLEVAYTSKTDASYSYKGSTFRNIYMDGTDQSIFSTMIRLTENASALFENIKLIGTNRIGTGIELDGACIDPKFTDVWIHSLDTGVLIGGETEGGNFVNCHMVGNKIGVSFDTPLSQPGGGFDGCHINATTYCILGNNRTQVTINSCLLYSTNADVPTTNIKIQGNSEDWDITDNIFQGTNDAGDDVCIDIEGGSLYNISDNTSRNKDIGVILGTSVFSSRIQDNDFRGAQQIINNSTSTDNRIQSGTQRGSYAVIGVPQQIIPSDVATYVTGFTLNQTNAYADTEYFRGGSTQEIYFPNSSNLGQLTMQLYISNSVNPGRIHLEIRKNGLVNAITALGVTKNTVDAGNNMLNITTGLIPLADNDYYQVVITQTTGVDLTVQDYSWISVGVIG